MKVAFALVNVIVVVNAGSGPITNFGLLDNGNVFKTSGSSPLSDGFRLQSAGGQYDAKYFFACSVSSPICKGLPNWPSWSKKDFYKVTLSFANISLKDEKTNYDWNTGIDGTTSDDEWVSEWCCPPESRLVKDGEDVVLFTDPGLNVKGFGLPVCTGIRQLDCITGSPIVVDSHSQKVSCDMSEYCLTCGPNNGYKSCTACPNFISKGSYTFTERREYGSFHGQDCRARDRSEYCDGDQYKISEYVSLPHTKLRHDSTAFLGASNNPPGSQFVFECPNAAPSANATEKIVYECGNSGKFELKINTCEVYCDGRPDAVQKNLDLYYDKSLKNLHPNLKVPGLLRAALTVKSPALKGTDSQYDQRINTFGSLAVNQRQSTANPELGQTQGSQLVYDCNIPKDIAHGKAGVAVFQCSKQGQFEVLTFTCPLSWGSDEVVVDGRRQLRGKKK